MKSRVLLIITTVLLFGVGIAVYAYNSNPTATETVATSCCCCSGDSCPMKSADARAAADAGKECCCKDGAESCPMMKKADVASPLTKEADSKDKVSTKAGCCCGDSCAMKKAGADHKMAGMTHDAKMEGSESCPMMKDSKMAESHKGMNHMSDGPSGCCCSCCTNAKEKKVIAAN